MIRFCSSVFQSTANDFEAHCNAIRLLAAPPARQKQRKELLGMKNALLQGQQILNELQQKKYGGETSWQTNTADSLLGFGCSSFGMPTPVPDEMEDVNTMTDLEC